MHDAFGRSVILGIWKIFHFINFIVSSGEVKELTKEQVEKVSRKKTITDELEDLELDLKLQE